MSSSASERSNPFPGLRPFRSDERHLFFGREDQIGELLERLRQSRFLAVVGPSGSGKSSLVRAGLLPELHGGTMVSAGSHWEVVVMRPGGDPLTNLAAALVEADLYDPEQVGIVDQVRTTLDRSALGLGEALRQSDIEEGTNTLVVVDQFEEIFRFRGQGGQSVEEASAFIKLLLEASVQDSVPVYVVLTMRSDYLGECAQFRGLAEAVNEGEYLIPRLTRAQRRLAISGPIQVGGAEISKRLLTKLLNDVGDDPDQLPVLQHALMRTWSIWARDHSDEEPVDLRHYESTGGMQEALSRHADEVFDALGGDREQALAERVFKSLTERVDETRGIRRPLRLGRLAEITGAAVEDVTKIVNAFRRQGCTFLMPPERVELSPRTVIDISHESLMRVWQRLRRWTDAEAQSAAIYRRLDETARLHADGRASLYHDPDLGIALSWRDENQPNAAWAELHGGDFHRAMEFLERSQDEAERQERERETARQRELAQAKALAESQARTARLMRRFAITVCVALVVAVALAGWALRERGIAEKATIEARIEHGKTWLANARALRDSKDFFGAKLKAARALGFTGHGREGSATEFTERFHPLLQPELSEWQEASALIATTPDFMPLWQSGSPPQHSLMVNDACVSPLGTIAVTAPEDPPGLHVWDMETGAELAVLDEHEDDVEAVGFSPDGLLLASAENRTVILWDVQGRNVSLSQRRDFESDDFRSLDFSRDGKRVVIADTGGKLFAWDLESGETSGPILLHDGARIDDIEFSPDGSLLATGGWDGAVTLLSGETLQPLATLVSPIIQPPTHSGRTARVHSLGFSPDGRRLVVGAERLPVTIWDTATREPVARLLDEEWKRIVRSENGDFRTGVSTLQSAVAFSPDGKTLAVGWDEVGSQSNVPVRPTLTVFDVAGEKMDRPARIADLAGQSAAIRALRYAPDSRRVLAAAADGSSWLWDLEGREPVGGRSTGHSASIASLAFSRDGRRFASGDDIGVIRVWEASTGRLVSTLEAHADTVASLCFSGDAERIFSVGRRDFSFRAWDIASGEAVRVDDLGFVLTSVDLSPSGKTLAVGGWSEEIRLYDAERLSAPRSVSLGTGINHLRFLARESRLAIAHDSSGGEKHEVMIFELGDGDVARRVGHGGDRSHEGWIRALSASPDGTRLVSSSADGVVKLWDVLPDGSLAESAGSRMPQQESAVRVTFSPDGKRLATAAARSVRLWSADDATLIAVLTAPHPVTQVVFNPHGGRLLTGGRRGILQMWGARDNRVRHVFAGLTAVTTNSWYLTGPGAVCFEPSSGRLIIAGGQRDDPGAIAVWDLSGQEPSQALQLSTHDGAPTALAPSPDGSVLASGANDLILWDLQSGTRRAVAGNLESAVRSLAFSPDGATLVSGHVDGKARFWNPGTGLTEVGTPLQHSRALLGIVFSPDGSRLFTSGGSDITIWSFDSPSRENAPLGRLVGGTERMRALAISPDGRLLASVGGGVRLWDLATLKQRGPALEHPSWVYRVAFSADGSLVAAGGGASTLRIWETTGSGRLVAEVAGNGTSWRDFVSGVAFSANGTTLAASRSTGDVTLWNVAALSRKNELASYADVIELEEASGGVTWDLRSRSLRPAGEARRFRALGE